MKLAKSAFICFAIVLAISSASAQSGKVTSTQPTPAPLPTAPAPRIDSRPVPVRNAPKYKLVFSAVREFDDFVNQLNQNGEAGYRLKSAAYGWQKSDRKNYFRRPVGLLQLDEGRYEYDWFQTTSYWFFGVDGFDAKYAELAKRGFRLVDHFYSGGTCEPGDCKIFDLFLLERTKDAAQPREFRVAGLSPGRRMKLDLTAELNEAVAAGFYPISLFSKFQVLLETLKFEDRPDEKPDIQWTNLESKMKVLAKQGYRLAFMHDEAMVMYRYPGSDTPLQYVKLKVGKGDLEKRLKELGENGATFRTIYRDLHWSGEKLVLEQRMISDGSRRDLRALRFKFQLVEDIAGKAQIELSPPGKEALKTFNELISQGFVVRTLFGSDNVGVLLER